MKKIHFFMIPFFVLFFCLLPSFFVFADYQLTYYPVSPGITGPAYYFSNIPTTASNYNARFIFPVTLDDIKAGLVINNPSLSQFSCYIISTDFDIVTWYDSIEDYSVVNQSPHASRTNTTTVKSSAATYTLSGVSPKPAAFYYLYIFYSSPVSLVPSVFSAAATPTPTLAPTPSPTLSPTSAPTIVPVPSSAPGIGSASEELGSFNKSGLSVWDMFVNLLDSVGGPDFGFSSGVSAYSDRADQDVVVYSDSAVSSESSSDPDLSDYTFWSYCFDTYVKNGATSSRVIKHRFVPFSTSNFSGSATYNYVYTYRVKIPFRAEASNFHGVGYFDANYKFDLKYDIFGVDGYGLSSPATALNAPAIDFSSPWVESSDGVGFNATAGSPYGYSFDIINMPLVNGTTEEFYYCFDMYVSLSSPGQLINFGDYVDISISNLSFNVLTSYKVSDSTSEGILGEIRDQQKEYHDEEQSKAEEAVDSITSGVDDVTGLLSKWEIITLPVTVITDLVGALSSDGSTGLTFPSFSIMGQQIWPDYTFDLSIISERFPVLHAGLHLMTGIMVVSWFLHYLWRKWHILMGDDMPEAGAGGDD